MKIAADDLEDLVKVGLLYEVNKEHKFSHQTYGEFGFNKFLARNFDDEDCAKFIVEVVLVDPSFQIIRAFLNFWILGKLDQKTFEIYRKKLLSSSTEEEAESEDDEETPLHVAGKIEEEAESEDDDSESLSTDSSTGEKYQETPLHVAGEEGNENIFWFLYSSLASKTQDFENKKKEIENFLLKFLKCSALAFYFQNCTDSFDVLTKIENDFGTDFVRKIFEFGDEDDEINLLHAISESGRNVLKVLKFLRETFAEDLEFLGEVFLSRGYDGRSFLHVAFKNLKNETLSSLLDELNEWKKMSFFGELILMGSELVGVFLSSYALSDHLDNDFFLSFLHKLKLLVDDETLKTFFLIVDDEYSLIFLHRFCLWAKNFNLLGTLEWINREIGKDFLLDLILKRDNEDRTIFHNFTESKDQPNSGAQLLEILKFFKENLKIENKFLLKEILFSVDRRGVFLDIFSMFEDEDLLFDIFDFLTKDLGLSVESLKSYLNEIKGYFLFSISQIEEESRVRIFELFEDLLEKLQIPFYSDDFYSAEILHRICENHSKSDVEKILKYFNFVEEKNDFGFLKNYFSGKNSESQTILVHFHHSYSNLTKVFKWLEEKFKNEKNFLKNFLMQVDENGDSFFTFILGKCYDFDVDYFFTATFKFLIRNFDKSFVQNFLLIQNKRQENCLNLVCQRRDWRIPEILGLLSKGFQNDQEFFTKLLNEELKENEKVREWIKNNLDFIDLQEVSNHCSESSQEDSDSSIDRYSDEDQDSSFTEKELKVENPIENSDLIRSNNDSNVDQFEIEETSNNDELVLNACQSKCCCKIC